MIIDPWLIALATLGSFAAGFIDAVVGGGGLVQVPLLFILFPQLSHANIIATNRLSSVAGTLVAARQYLKSVTINIKYVFAAGILAAIASFGGTFVMQRIPKDDFKILLFFIILALTIYSIFKKQLGHVDTSEKSKKPMLVFALIGICLGLYNGIIGPGTGTLLVFSLVQFARLNFIQSSAYAKLINAIADLASLIAFIFQGAIIFSLALPMLVGNMCGAYLGSKIALKNGNGFIRIFFILIMILLLSRMAKDIWF